MRIRRLLLAASLILAGPAFGQLPRPGVMIPASKVSISGYTNTDLQSGLSEGEIASIRPAADCTLVDGGKPNEICRDTDDQTLWICTNATECNHADWVAHGGGGGSGDSVFVEGVGATNLDLIGGTTGIDITLNTGPSPDTATFALDWSEITNVVTEASLKAVDSPADEECLTYESGGGGDFEWQACGGGAAATSLDSGQTGTTYDVKFGTTTTQWYTDLNGDDVVDTGEQIRLATRKQVIATTLNGAGINTAVTACGGVPCDIHLLAGTYTEVCLNLTTSTNDIHFSGQGKGITILKPDADLDDCVATTSGQTIGLNGADDIEMDNFTLDGDKELYGPPSCLAGGLANCGTGFWLNSPSNLIAHRFHLHDVEIKDIIATAVSIEHGDSPIIERVTITNIGCNQSDTICGNGAGHSGWDAISDYGPANSKSKATGITMNGIRSTSGTIQDNIISRTTYTGIESYVGAKGHRIVHNDITLTPGGITVNGGIHTYIAENYSHANAQHAGTGQAGTGVLIIGDADYVTLTDNKITANDSSGVVVSASGTDGKGHIIIDNNEITGNCVDHNAGGNVFINGASVVYDLLFRNNVVTGSSTCPYALDSNWNSVGSLGYNGSVIFEGGLYDAGTTGAVKLWNPNMMVHGLNITGNLLFTAQATGIAFGNTVSGTTTYTAGSKMTVIDNGVMNLSGGTSSGQLQIKEPSARGSNQVTFVAPDSASFTADTNYILPLTDGTANDFLQTDGTGTLTWAAGGGGSGTVTDVGNCNGPTCFTGTEGTTLTSTTSEVLDLGTANTLIFKRDDNGAVTFTGADLASPANTIYDTTGAGTITVGSADVTSITFSTDDTGDGSDVVLPTGSVSGSEILDNTITASDLSSVIAFADGDLVDWSAVSVTGAVEGIILPQHATSCASATAEGQICWEADANHLWVGDGASAVDIGPGGGSGDVVAASNTQTFGSGAAATVVHTFNVTGTDDVVTYGNATTGFNGSLTAQGSFSFDTLDPILYWDDGSFADGTIETLTRGWAVSDDNGAFAVEVESGTPGSYYTPLIVHSSSGTTSLYLGGDGAEQAAPTNAIKVSEAGAMTAIGTGTINGSSAGTDVITTGQLLVGNGTGTGTYESNVAIAGTMTATSFTASPSATPTLAMRDSDNADSEDNVRLFANCVVTTSGAEDCTATLDQYVDGAVKNAFSSIGDGAGTIGSDQNTSWTITTDGTGDAELTVPAQSINLTTEVIGALPIANGGTGTSTPTYHYDVSWKAPVIADDVYVKVGNGAITLAKLDCITTGSTTPSAFIITVDECTNAGATCVASGGTITATANTTDYTDSTFTDAAVDDDDWIRFDITSLTTAPDYAHCRLEYTQP